MRCTNCEQPLRAGLKFCTKCGVALAPVVGLAQETPSSPAPAIQPVASRTAAAQPAQAHRALRVPVMVIGAVLVLVIIGMTVALASAHDGSTTQASTGQVSNSGGTVGLPDTTSQQDPNQTGDGSTDSGAVDNGSAGNGSADNGSTDDGAESGTATPGQLLDPASAHAALDQEVATDQPAADQLIGSWVPQLSSKRPGLVADGIAYDYPQIWANFQSLKSQYPSVLLIWSGDFASYASGDFYVTVLPDPVADGPSANAWCDNAGIAVDDCYAKFLSTTGDATGTTLLRQ